MRPIVLVLAAALVATSCGGGDDELSVEEYRERGNELCAKVEREIEKIDLPTSPEGIASWLEELIDVTRPYDREYEELDPPEQLERLHRKSIELIEDFNDRLREIAERVRAAENPAMAVQRELERLLPQIERSEALSRRLGLDECLKPFLEPRQSNPS